MANPQLGDVPFNFDGKQYKLRFSAEAICELEDAFDMPFNALAQQFNDPTQFRMSTLRQMYLAGLHDCQPATDMAEVKAILKGMSPKRAVDLIAKAIELAFPADPPGPGQEKPTGSAA